VSLEPPKLHCFALQTSQELEFIDVEIVAASECKYIF
jgi:hypothetical protein